MQAVPSLLRQAVPGPPQERAPFPRVICPRQAVPQAFPVDSTLSPAESELSQAGSSQSSPEDSTLSQSNISQAGSSQAFPVDNIPSPAESEISQVGSTQSSQAGSSQSSLEDSTLQAESAVLPQAVRHSARLRASQASHIPQAGNSS